MNVHEQTIARNNYAVALIESGNYEEAISSLSITLKSFKQVVVQRGDVFALNTLTLDECMASSSSSPSALNDDINTMPAGFFLYDKAIAIPVARIGTSYDECRMTSCVIVFNLALAHHLHFRSSVPSNPRRKFSLSKALKLYDLSIKVQSEAVLEGSGLYRLAAINNIGVLYRQMHNEEAATKCFEFVLSILAYFAQDFGRPKVFALDGFIRNVSNLISQTNVAPAA